MSEDLKGITFCRACGIREPFLNGEDEKLCPNQFRNGRHEWYMSFDHATKVDKHRIVSAPVMQMPPEVDFNRYKNVNSKLKELSMKWIDLAQADTIDYMKGNINQEVYERLRLALRDSICTQIKEELLND